MRVGFSLDVASWFSCVLRSSGKGGKAGEATHKETEPRICLEEGADSVTNGSIWWTLDSGLDCCENNDFWVMTMSTGLTPLMIRARTVTVRLLAKLKHHLNLASRWDSDVGTNLDLWCLLISRDSRLQIETLARSEARKRLLQEAFLSSFDEWWYLIASGWAIICAFPWRQFWAIRLNSLFFWNLIAFMPLTSSPFRRGCLLSMPFRFDRHNQPAARRRTKTRYRLTFRVGVLLQNL